MPETIEHKIDRTGWAPGPWDSEPDRIEWRSEGIPCLIVRNRMGALCGYAGVSPRHPWNRKGYNECVKGCAEVPAKPLESIMGQPVPEIIQKVHMAKKYFVCDEDYKLGHTPESIIEIHGGLTYSDACQGAICHVPLPGEPDPVWWFGFDCAHSGDVSPGLNSALLRVGGGLGHAGEYYKDVGYVKAEVEKLAAQLREMKNLPG